MADELNTTAVVIHAGRYEAGKKNEAYAGFSAFLDTYYDPRFILENLPAVYRDMQFIGLTARDLAILSGGKIKKFCLDFAHLYCTANYCTFPFTTELSCFSDLRVSLHHLSNSRRFSCRDEHLPLDHPEGGLDFDAVMGWIARHPRVQTSLEYKYRDAGIYYEQVRVFDRLFREFQHCQEK